MELNTATPFEKTSKRHGMKTAGPVAIVGGLAVLASGMAQAALDGRSGHTLLQSNSGLATDSACTTIGAIGSPTTDQAAFAALCTALAHTANQIDGAGPTANSLGLTEAQLAAALQQAAPEEAAAAGSLATETSFGQMSNVMGRLATLRAGAGGTTLAQLKLNGENATALAALGRTGTALGGGAAGDGIGASGRLSGFVNGSFSKGDKDATASEDGFDFDTRGITAGVDYRFTDDFVAGVAVGYAKFEADFDTSTLISGGDAEVKGYSVSGYGTYYTDAYYVEGVIGFGKNDVDTRRLIAYASNTAEPSQSGAANSGTDSDQFSLSITAGYDMSSGDMNYGPYLRLTHLNTELDGYTETGAGPFNVVVADQEIDSTRTALGFSISKAMSTSSGVISPSARIEWIHEFDDDARTISSYYAADPSRSAIAILTDDPDRDFFTLALGVAGAFPGGTQAFANYETVLGLEDISEHAFTIGLRQEF